MTKGYVLSPSIEPISLTKSVEEINARIVSSNDDTEYVEFIKGIRKSLFILPGATITFFFFPGDVRPFGFDVETIDIN